MTAAAQHQPLPLYVEKSYIEYLQQQQLQQHTEIAWQVAAAALWQTQEFSPTEIQQAKNFISNYLLQSSSPERAFSQWVQRVLLARYYVQAHPGRWIPIPTEWLNADNKKGFAGTKSWFDAVEITRRSIPNYKQALGSFPTAIWQTATSRSPQVFHHWRSWFIQQQAQGLCNLFLSTIACCTNGRT